MATLQGRAIKDTFKDLLQVSNSNNGVDGTLRTIEDGEGTSSAIQVSTGAVKVNGTLEVTGDVTGVPHVDYKGVYTGSTSYVKDDVVTYNGSSYINTTPSTGVAPTNTNNWGLLASKGTDGTDGADGADGATGPQGPQGPAGADGSDGADGNSFNDLVEISGGAADGQDQYRIGGANSLGSSMQGQLSIVSGADAIINLESTQTTEGGDASVIMKGATTGLFMEEDVPAQTAGSTWNFGVSSSALTSGVWKNAGPNDPNKFTQSATILELKTYENTDGSDGNGGAYSELGSYPVFGVYKIGAALDLVNLDTSDVINTMTSDGDKVVYMDQGSNLNFRSKQVGAGGAHRIYSTAVAATETDVPNNVSLHLASDKHDTPTDTFGYRVTGRTIAYTGTSSDTNLERVGSNIKSYQTAIQTQKANMRTTFTLQYEAEDLTQSDYGGGTQQFLSAGQATGFFAGIYLNAASNGQQRSLTPANYFDGGMNLGVSTHRWATVFATTGSISTSDRNAKQDIEDLSDAEKSVAVALKGLIKKYRFKDAVAQKGDDARIHIGVIAQDVEQAFSDAGLDGFRYGLLCKDTVWKVMVDGVHTGVTQAHGEKVDPDDNGNEIEGATLEEEVRYSVRYDELLAFVVSAL